MVIYTGILAEPIRYQQPPGPLATEATRRAWVNQRVEDWRIRMNALFDFYGIEQGNWCMLAGTLAEKHVPGFDEEKAPRGAKTKWDELTRARLKIHVDDYIREKLPKRVSIAAAIKIIIRRDPWKGMISRSTKPEAAIRKQYDLTDDMWVKTLRMAIAWEIHGKNPDMPLEEVNARAGVVVSE